MSNLNIRNSNLFRVVLYDPGFYIEREFFFSSFNDALDFYKVNIPNSLYMDILSVRKRLINPLIHSFRGKIK